MTKKQIETALEDLTHELLAECASVLDKADENKESEDLQDFISGACLSGKVEGILLATAKIIALRKDIKKDDSNDA